MDRWILGTVCLLYIMSFIYKMSYVLVWKRVLIKLFENIIWFLVTILVLLVLTNK